MFPTTRLDLAMTKLTVWFDTNDLHSYVDNLFIQEHFVQIFKTCSYNFVGVHVYLNVYLKTCSYIFVGVHVYLNVDNASKGSWTSFKTIQSFHFVVNTCYSSINKNHEWIKQYIKHFVQILFLAWLFIEHYTQQQNIFAINY